jgi:hypothetical protein
MADGYRNYIEKYCIKKFGDYELAAIEPMEVFAMLAKLFPISG